MQTGLKLKALACCVANGLWHKSALVDWLMILALHTNNMGSVTRELQGFQFRSLDSGALGDLRGKD